MEVEEPEAPEIRTRIKLKINNFMNNVDDDDPFGYLELEKYLIDHNLVIIPSIENSLNNKKKKKKKIITYFLVVIDWIFILRFSILAVVNKKWISILLGDQLYLLEAKNLIAVMFIFLALIGVIVQQVIIYHESNLILSLTIFL